MPFWGPFSGPLGTAEITINSLRKPLEARRSMSATKEKAQYITKSAVKEFFKKHNKRVAADTLDALNGEIECLLTKAIDRTEKNKRSTVQPQDL